MSSTINDNSTNTSYETHTLDADDNNNADSIEKLCSNVILALDGNMKRIGGCCFDIEQKSIWIIEDMRFYKSDFNEFLSAINKNTVTSKSFASSAGARVINSIISILDEGDQLYTPLNTLKFSKYSSIALGCFNAVSSALESEFRDQNIDAELGPLFVKAEYFTFSDILYIETETLHDLHIMDKPNYKRSNQGHKRMKSLFEILDLTGSKQGSFQLRKWFKSPLCNKQMINERYDVIEVMKADENMQYLENIGSHLKQLPNVNNILTSFQVGNSPPKSWFNISRFLEETISIYREICTIFLRLENPPAIINQIVETIKPRMFSDLQNEIKRVIDFESSKSWNKVMINQEVLSTGERTGKTYKDIDNVLYGAITKLQHMFPHIPGDDLGIIFLPSLGFLISIDEQSIDLAIPNWNQVFSSESTIYFKDEMTASLDEENEFLYEEIIEGEIEIMHELQTLVLSVGLQISEASKVLAELDCYVALTKVSLLMGFVRPEIVDTNEITIRKGRNPTYEQIVSSYIPNDTSIENGDISVITGANASGKSVYMFQVAIIVFLAHIGSHVPAEYAKIGLTDKILAKVTSTDSLDRCESTFSLDLHKMNKCLNMATEKSLLLVDEFGKGTDVIGGPSLLGALIENISKQQNRPKLMVTTHFHELFKEGILHDIPQVKHSHMDILLKKGTDDGGKSEEITHLYQLKPGVAMNSFGIE
ncbi:DNA mismatch repair protein [Wickerhamomyces ciferrii]|uniref:DNA mismatch repair protein n=1 Tax=Wickerhamomyces ciferrii (strain ATCC 14091 / BCRC 22168 / CBS 111 / JCM 3599 / NBRC 0793 / NRRL Y-1031 F-60-10) TaxID=1206466 RepID=K0KNL2_WICCF|nr:DNA mismatch repair protein [Wickerhamomyces ciferrii]CCH44581.1 DNA mismatch repair protein [Wickerhamomyces ciferrii]